MVGAAVVIGQVVVLSGAPGIAEAFLGVLTGALVSSSSMIMNDYFDLESDRVNAPSRPLPRGSVSLGEARQLAVTTGAAGMLASAFLGWLALGTAGLFWLVGFTYSWRLKATGLPGNALVSASVGIPFVYGSISVGDPSDSVIWFFFFVAFLANMGREVAKGIADVRGDELRQVKTVARGRGTEFAGRLSSLFLFSAILLSYFPYLLALLGEAYLLLVSVSNVVIGYIGLRLLRIQTASEVSRLKQRLLYGMILALMAFVVGALMQ
jgi:geranylgeranylglycerol-phosphate geranylgeranyltransferase